MLRRLFARLFPRTTFPTPEQQDVLAYTAKVEAKIDAHRTARGIALDLQADVVGRREPEEQ